jgi:biopolymer transport protein ExbB/TolQ
MEDKSFISLLAEKFNLVGGIIAFLVLIGTFVTTKELWLAVSVCLLIICLVLMYALYNLFQKLKKSLVDIKSCQSEFNSTKKRLSNLENKFESQSREYEKNILALDIHKRITHVVEVLISAQSPQTAEGKKIIKILKSSVEKSMKDSD